MSITLGGVDLTEKMYWADRYGWSPVGQSADYAADGSRHITENARGSRPITLEMYPECYLPTDMITALLALADALGASYTLTVDAVNYTVKFWRGNGPPIETERADPLKISDDWHTATIRLIQSD